MIEWFNALVASWIRTLEVFKLDKSLRSQFVDLIVTQMRTCTRANGFDSDVGQKVFRSHQFFEDDVPFTNIIDGDATVEHSYQTGNQVVNVQIVGWEELPLSYNLTRIENVSDEIDRIRIAMQQCLFSVGYEVNQQQVGLSLTDITFGYPREQSNYVMCELLLLMNLQESIQDPTTQVFT